MFDWFNKNKDQPENVYKEKRSPSQRNDLNRSQPEKKQSNFRFPLVPDEYDAGESTESYSYGRVQSHQNTEGNIPSAINRRRRTYEQRIQGKSNLDEMRDQPTPPVQNEHMYAGELSEIPSYLRKKEKAPVEMPNTTPLFNRRLAKNDGLDSQPAFLRKNKKQMPPSPFQADLQYIDAEPKKIEKDLHIFEEKQQTEPRKFFRPTPFVSPVYGRLDTPEAPREKRQAYERNLEKLYGGTATKEKAAETQTSNAADQAVCARIDELELEGLEVSAEKTESDFRLSETPEMTVVDERVYEVAGGDEVKVDEALFAGEEIIAGIPKDPRVEEATVSIQKNTDQSMELQGQSDVYSEYADLTKSIDHTIQAIEKKEKAIEPQPRTLERMIPVNVMMFNEDKRYLQKKQIEAQRQSRMLVNTEGIDKTPQAQEERSASIPTKPTEVSSTVASAAAKPRAEISTEASEIEACAYVFPSLDLLKEMPYEDNQSCDYSADEKAQVLDQVLKDFNVGGKVVSMTKGPTVTRYEVQPDPGVKVNKIVNLADDLKLNLAAQDIRIEAPIPGKSMVGIEIPNAHPRPVFLREILAHPDFSKKPSNTKVALGLNIEGAPVTTDIRSMPHGLIAGSTGSGKSVCINSILISLLYQAHPNEVKFMLIDPKMVELASYHSLPHLVCPVITDAKAATKALKWAVDEMERRYELFSKIGVRDINRYNELASRETRGEKMPAIVIIIDELADLMMVAANEVESHICRIAQKARACGIHLILATQRPSVDVITGLIKANIPSRIAFSVSSQIDSRTILDTNGAERLLGKGDMLLSENGSGKLLRVQGTYVSDDEIEEVVSFVRKQMAPQYLFTAEEMVIKDADADEDELFSEILEFAIEAGTVSTSMIQRKFRIGYNRAARIIDVLEEKGYITGANGSKPREVLVDQIES